MPFQITTTVTCYLLPQDGAQAKGDFLKHLLDPGETWITAYAFTLTDMINDLIAAHKAGFPCTFIWTTRKRWERWRSRSCSNW